MVVKDEKREQINERLYSDLADYLKALAHPTRLRILKALLNGEMCVKSLWEELDLQQSNVSQHLTTLKSRGIISSRREGAKICYSLVDPRAKEVLQILLESPPSEED
ncbi:MAG TPA: ArsR family transcriptional regulator [Thermosulfidibacter takaii]|uniref:ArsR family transcriptional regulator n=1 Tax=Thermosulfidibacter takaii TaxID=412593 RepID=A0A7C0YB08_9BACT|nr:ArsR family transcriptional regulator [Thermosulfidibacter takaii]